MPDPFFLPFEIGAASLRESDGGGAPSLPSKNERASLHVAAALRVNWLPSAKGMAQVNMV